VYNITIKIRQENKMRTTICYATMIKDGKKFIYELEREDYSLFDFDKEFQKIAKQRGWQYVECGTTPLL
jgi:hypothetical protein